MLRIILIICIFLQLPVYAGSGEATYYHDWFINRKTSLGVKFNQHQYTAASNFFELKSVVEVTNLRNYRKVRVLITDRGGFNIRDIDLSKAAFKSLDNLSKGRIKVKYRLLYKASNPVIEKVFKIKLNKKVRRKNARRNNRL